jgi:hypothetical protein
MNWADSVVGSCGGHALQGMVAAIPSDDLPVVDGDGSRQRFRWHSLRRPKGALEARCQGAHKTEPRLLSTR